MDIINRIGAAAALEQLAEECTELAQAALKMARCLRGENPVAGSMEEMTDHIHEEIADVQNVLSILEGTYLYDPHRVARIMEKKMRRWRRRLSRWRRYDS